MKNPFLCLFLFITSGLSAQELSYFYDETGNRTSRERQTIILPNQDPAAGDSTSIAVESIFDITIKVYPNPTQGLLTIEIEDFEIETPIDLVVFDRYNQLLLRQTVEQPVIYLNLSQYASNTWYIVAFMLNGERRDFKIIKQ